MKETDAVFKRLTPTPKTNTPEEFYSGQLNYHLPLIEEYLEKNGLVVGSPRWWTLREELLLDLCREWETLLEELTPSICAEAWMVVTSRFGHQDVGASR